MNEHKPLLNNFKKTQRKAVLRLVALLLAAITLLLSSAWAWFRGEDDRDATAEGLSMKLAAQGSLLLSVSAPDDVVDMEDETKWKKSIDIMNDTDLLEELDMLPATGVGYGTKAGENYLQVPVLKYNTNGTVSVNRDLDWSEPTENEDYISLKVSFMTEFPADIYIGEGTSVTTWTENNDKLLTDNEAKNIGNISKYGNFSRDAIVGALRMSVYSPDTGSRFLWIPRPDVHLSTDVASDDYVLNVTGQQLSDYWNGSHSYYDLTKYIATTGGCAMLPGAFTATENNANDAHMLTKIGSTEKGTMCSVYLKIWIEGSDSESVQALSRGMFQLDINFVAVETG